MIAEANLGRSKIGSGDKAVQWLLSGDPELIQRAVDYCQDDVQLVRELHQLLLGPGLTCPPRPDRQESETLIIRML